MMKNRYVPVDTVPIFFFLKSTSEVIGELNGFKIIRCLVTTDRAVNYYCRGKHIWIRT